MNLQLGAEDWLQQPIPLDGLHRLIWQTLEQACAAAEHPWNLGALSTVDEQGKPRSRTVVLRQVDSMARNLDCFTDQRSPKCRELASTENAPVSWLFYDVASKIQLRLHGVATLITEGKEWENLWNLLPLHRRAAYLSEQAPGTSVSGERPPKMCQADVDDPERGREHFTVIRTRVAQADWLYLRHGGHVRAVVQYDELDGIQASWRVP